MVKVIIINKKGYKVDADSMVRVVEKALSVLGQNQKTEVVVSLVGETEMAGLHKTYQRTKKVTDVLSFPLEFDQSYPDGTVRMGDIVVCYQKAIKQAKSNGKTIQEEIDFLVDHGCRHLMGLHHE